MILFSGFGDGLGPVAVVQGIRVELGFQSNATALAVDCAALAGFLQEVSGIELNTGAVGVYRHGSAGVGVKEGGAGVAEDLPVVVVAPLKVQRLIIGIDILTDGLGAAEVHGGSLHASELSCGDIGGIVQVEEPAGKGQHLTDGSFCILVAGEVEVAVIGEIENCVHITDGIVDDVQAAGVIQGVGHLNLGIARKALIQMGAGKGQCDSVFLMADQHPQPLVVAIGAGVEVVSALIGGHGVDLASQREGGSLNPVGVAANGGPQKSAVCGAVAVAAVIAQNHIFHITGTIGNQQPHQSGTVICDGGGD